MGGPVPLADLGACHASVCTHPQLALTLVPASCAVEGSVWSGAQHTHFAVRTLTECLAPGQTSVRPDCTDEETEADTYVKTVRAEWGSQERKFQGSPHYRTVLQSVLMSPLSDSQPAPRLLLKTS